MIRRITTRPSQPLSRASVGYVRSRRRSDRNPESQLMSGLPCEVAVAGGVCPNGDLFGAMAVVGGAMAVTVGGGACAADVDAVAGVDGAAAFGCSALPAVEGASDGGTA